MRGMPHGENNHLEPLQESAKSWEDTIKMSIKRAPNSRMLSKLPNEVPGYAFHLAAITYNDDYRRIDKRIVKNLCLSCHRFLDIVYADPAFQSVLDGHMLGVHTSGRHLVPSIGYPLQIELYMWIKDYCKYSSSIRKV